MEKSGPGMAARRTQAAWRAKADLTIRTSKALRIELAIESEGHAELLCEKGREEEKTHLRATKVKVKRSNSHLSVCGAVTSDFAFPSEDASERSVVLEPSIFLKLARCRMYLTRMAMMQTLPTTQQQSTGWSLR